VVRGSVHSRYVQVAGNPHAQLGEEVGAHITAMNHSIACNPPPPDSSSNAASAATPVNFRNRLPSLSSIQAARDLRSSLGGSSTVAACKAEDATVPRQQVLPDTNASPNDMEDCLHWPCGRTPAQILQQPIVQGSGPLYTEDQHAGGWLDTDGTLRLRRHGVNSLPSGALSLGATTCF
jgi:hypothetical protein